MELAELPAILWKMANEYSLTGRSLISLGRHEPFMGNDHCKLDWRSFVLLH